MTPRRAAGGLLSALRRLQRDERGAATVEFVILVPIFMAVMFNSIEASILMMRGTLLDRGLDMAMRELRLNTGSPPSYDEFRALVCDHAGLVECMSYLEVELQAVDPDDEAMLDTSAPASRTQPTSCRSSRTTPRTTPAAASTS